MLLDMSACGRSLAQYMAIEQTPFSHTGYLTARIFLAYGKVRTLPQKPGIYTPKYAAYLAPCPAVIYKDTNQPIKSGLDHICGTLF